MALGGTAGRVGRGFGVNSIAPRIAPRTCLDACGVGEAGLADGVQRSARAEFAMWTQWAGRVLVF